MNNPILITQETVLEFLTEYYSNNYLTIEVINYNKDIIIIKHNNEELTVNVAELDSYELDVKLIALLLLSSFIRFVIKLDYEFFIEGDKNIYEIIDVVDTINGQLVNLEDDYMLIDVHSKSIRTILENNKSLIIKNNNSLLELKSIVDEAYNINNMLRTANKHKRNPRTTVGYQRRMRKRLDPAAAMKRSRAAKLRWRKNRGKILRGMKKFHKSAQGKRFHKVLGQVNSKMR